MLILQKVDFQKAEGHNHSIFLFRQSAMKLWGLTSQIAVKSIFRSISDQYKTHFLLLNIVRCYLGYLGCIHYLLIALSKGS